MTPFAHKLLTWYDSHQRDLPWRKISDAYRIWVSEIILQQTRVAQGYEYYLRFIETFPTVQDLASADEDEVLRLWQGLGYYSRARNMHTAAKQIVSLGCFPTDYEGVRALKGIGDYTAAAICSFAFGLPCAVLDGNVYRILSRYFGIETPIDCSKGKKEFFQVAQALLPIHHSAEYNQAIMDFGALQCVPKSPKCSQCPLVDSCVANNEMRIEELPVKAHRTKVIERFFVYINVRTPEGEWLHRRSSGDIWQGLYEYPLLEFTHKPTLTEVLEHPFIQALPKGFVICLRKENLKHILTHRIIWADAYSLTYDFNVVPIEDYKVVCSDKLSEYGMSKLQQIIMK